MSSVPQLKDQGRTPYWGLWEECVQAPLSCWLNPVPKVVELGSHFPLTVRQGCSLLLEALGTSSHLFSYQSPSSGKLPLSPASDLSALPPATSL